MKDQDSKDKVSELRRRAEVAAVEKSLGVSDVSALSPEKIRELIHELQVHQIELEMQNDELRQAHVNMEELKDKYLDLYDLAPAGYVTLNDKGLILEANLTAVQLLGVGRQCFIKKPFSRFVSQEFGDAFYLYLQQVFETQSKQVCEIELSREDGTPFHAQLESVAAQDENGQFTRCRTILTEITERKRSEAALIDSKRFMQSTLNALSTHIAILDENGFIVAVNEAWSRFARDNDARLPQDGVGLNYLEFCDLAKGEWSEGAQTVAGMIREMIAGRREEFQWEYPCHGPSENRWFLLRATRFLMESQVRVALAHENVTERKMAEEDLRDSEEKYRTLFEESFDGLFITSPGGKILDMNKKGVAMFGYDTKEEILSLDLVRDVYAHPSDRKRLLGMVNAQGSAEYEVVVKKKSGEEMVTLCSLTTVKDKKDVITSYRGIIRDITERKRAEEDLRESEKRFRFAMEATNDGVWDWDLKTDNVFRSPGFFSMLGYREEEFRGRFGEWQNLVHPEDLAAVLQALNEYLDGTTENYEVEFRMVHKSGDTVWILSRGKVVGRGANGEPLRMIGTHTDITERKKAEKDLVESRGRLQIVLDTIPAAVFWKDRDLVYVGANRAWLEAAGLNSSQEVEGKTDYDLPWGKDQANSYREHDRKIIESGIPEYDIIEPFTHGDGALGWARTNKIPLRDMEHNIVGILGTYEDITERMLAEEALSESEERIRFLAEVIENSSQPFATAYPDGRIGIVNRAFCDLTGYSEEELRRVDWFVTLTAPEFLESETQRLNELVRTGKSVRYEKEYIRKDGARVPIELLVHVVRGETGEPLLYQGFLTDLTKRKQAEVSLARANKEWERTFNAISDLVMVLDNHHKILRANKAMADALGTTEQEMIGKSCHELVHGERQPPALCPHSRLLADGNEHFAEVSEPRLGGIHEVRVSPLIDEDELSIGCVHISRDVTEHKRSEEQLEKSRASFVNIVEKNHDGILVLDTDDSVIYANPAASALFGKPIGELMGIDFGSPVVSEEMTVVSLPRPNAEPVAAEMTVGSVDWYGTPAQLVMLHDVTDRMIFEKTLKASEERMRLLIESSPIGIRIVREGKTLYVNLAFTKIFGYERPEEVVGLSDEALFSSDDAALIREYEDECLRGKRTSEYHELKALKKSGELFDVSKWVTGIEFQGKPAVLGFVADTSQEKSLKTQLLQAQKMEAIGTLSGGIAHDFNNILTIVSGFSELLLAEKEENDKDYEDLQKIFRASQNGAELVRRLLTFSRKVEINLRPVKLNLQVKNVENLLVRTIPKTIRIELSLPDDLKVVNADSSQIEQALMNLAVNAIHAMPDGGNLVFETRNVTLSEEYSKTHLGVEPGEYVLLAVSDTGHGIERHVLERIFEPFFTTKKAGEGTGLGLAMVYGIVKGHGGHIACYSERGVGTTFKIHLPVYQEGEGLVEHKTEVIPAGGTETLLMVDDEESVRDLGTRLLSHFGYKVLIASNGLEGLEAYRKNREKIALVILDLIMPEMDGKHCLQELLKMNPQVKVIISSGYSSHGPVSEVMQGGAKGFVQKPYRGNDLLRTVRRILDEG